jgi:hypothetical protein
VTPKVVTCTTPPPHIVTATLGLMSPAVWVQRSDLQTQHLSRSTAPQSAGLL